MAKAPLAEAGAEACWGGGVLGEVGADTLTLRVELSSVLVVRVDCQVDSQTPSALNEPYVATHPSQPQL